MSARAARRIPSPDAALHRSSPSSLASLSRRVTPRLRVVVARCGQTRVASSSFRAPRHPRSRQLGFYLRFIALPLFYEPTLYCAAGIAVTTMTTSFYLAFFFAISHNFDGVGYVTPDLDPSEAKAVTAGKPPADKGGATS